MTNFLFYTSNKICNKPTKTEYMQSVPSAGKHVSATDNIDSGFVAGLPSSVCVVGCAFIMTVSVYQTSKAEAEICGSFKTDKIKKKTHKIAAMLFCLVFLYSLFRFEARESDIFKITVQLAQE